MIESNQLDRIDLELLVTLADRPIWKKRAADRMEDVSLQTVGRRIETLLNRGLVEATIIQPDGLDREQAIGYNTTEKGEETVEQYRICTECGTIKHVTEHQHTFTGAGDYLREHGGIIEPSDTS